MRKGFSIKLANMVGACRCNGWGSNPCDDARLPDEPNMPLTYNGRPVRNIYELLDHIETNAREAVSKYRKRRR